MKTYPYSTSSYKIKNIYKVAIYKFSGWYIDGYGILLSNDGLLVCVAFDSK